MSLQAQIDAMKAAKTGGLQAQIDAMKAAKAEPAPPEDTSNWVDRVNAAGQGLSLGFADEIGSGLAAGVASLGSDESFSDIYQSMMASEKAKRDTYKELHPKEAMALEIAGGLATGGAGAGRAAVTTAAKGALPKALSVAKGVGTAATEGAIQGFGSADGSIEDRAEGAKTGAIFGGGAKLGMDVLGKTGKTLLNQASKRRIAQELGRGDDFIPINIADREGALGEFYKNTVGRAYGGSAIAKQSRVVRDKAAKEITDTDAVFVDRVFKNSAPEGFDVDKLSTHNPQTALAELGDAWKNSSFQSVKGRDFRINDRELMDDIVAAVDDPALRDSTNGILDTIRKKVSKPMARDMIPPPKSRQYAADGVGVKKIPPAESDVGTIAGDDIMEARNWFKRNIQRSTIDPNTKLQNAAYAKAANAIDDRIRSQLDGDELKSFDTELDNWGKWSVVEESMGRAGKAGLDAPTPKMVLQSATGRRPKQAGLGTAPHQPYAKAEVARDKRLTQALKDAERATPPNTTGWSKAVNTGLLGAPTGGITPVALATGAGTAKTLSTPNAQRLLAGQTDPQKIMAELLRKYENSAVQTGGERLASSVRRAAIGD